MDNESYNKFKKQFKDKIDIPDFIQNPDMYREWFLLDKYIETHPDRIQVIPDKDGNPVHIDMTMSPGAIRKKIQSRPKAEQERLMSIASEFRSIIAKKSSTTRKWNLTIQKGNILDVKKTELLEMFGRLYTVDEVHKEIWERWGIKVSKPTVSKFYHDNLGNIDKLRSKYEANYSDLALTKKKSRLDKLSSMFYTLWQKFKEEERVAQSAELRNILKDIKQEVEGELIRIDFNGKLDVDMTLNINQKIGDIVPKIPIAALVVALVAAKAGIDPVKMMSKLASSYYSNLSGYGKKYNPNAEVVDVRSLIYNWTEITNNQESGAIDVMVYDKSELDQNTKTRVENKRNVMLNMLSEYIKKLENQTDDEQ